MECDRIVCLPDLLRAGHMFAEGFFDLVREPIWQGTGRNIGYPPGTYRPHNLQPGFNVQQLRALASGGHIPPHALWATSYHHLAQAAVDYLFAHLPANCMILTFEMPPWLRQACAARQVPYLDMRHSPLRFGRDLYVALHTNAPQVRDRMADWCVSDEELRLEAATLSANVRLHQRQLQEAMRYDFPLGECLIYTGHHSSDVALLNKDGRFLRCTDFQDTLHALAQGRRVLYLSPSDSQHRPINDYEPEGLVLKERHALAEICGAPVHPCPQNAYQVLSTNDDVVLTGIASPILQEAYWFDQPAHMLSHPFVPLAGMPNTTVEEGYIQVHFQDMLAPTFWHQLLAPERTPPRLPRLPSLDRHHARETLDMWWDYEKVLTWQRSLPHQVFERQGGAVLRARVDALEQQHSPLPRCAAAIERLKDTKQGQTAYILGTAPSLRELDIDALLAQESFWCNQAYELRKQGIAFRPRYYFVSDAFAIQRYGSDILATEAGTKFFRSEVYRLAASHHPEALESQHIIMYGDAHFRYMYEDDGYFSDNPAVTVHNGSTVVLDAIQFAFYMGYAQVYVGGVDLDWSQPNPYFFGGSAQSVVPMDAIVERQRRSFMVARAHFERHGRILAKITKSPHLPLDYHAPPYARDRI